MNAAHRFILSCARYIARHWRGECSLALAFWVNFLLLFCVLHVLERFALPPYLRGEWAVSLAFFGFFLGLRLLVYPWQVVGVIRACERHFKNQANHSWAIATQGAVVLSLLVTLIAAFASTQNFLAQQREQRALSAPAPWAQKHYSITLHTRTNADADGKASALLHIRGPFEVGITNAVTHWLAEHSHITGIILDSSGGQIYEGRGLARLIKKHNLATYSLERCASSCATAFIAGVTRTLGDNAKLGFHQYKHYATLPVIDITQEHAKDLAIFRQQGVAAEFLQKIFAQPPERMWWPETEELLRSGVIHQRGFSLNQISPINPIAPSKQHGRVK